MHASPLMRTYVTKSIRNVLLERAITVIGALSPCAIYPLNNVKRDIMTVNDPPCVKSTMEYNFEEVNMDFPTLESFDTSTVY